MKSIRASLLLVALLSTGFAADVATPLPPLPKGNWAEQPPANRKMTPMPEGMVQIPWKDGKPDANFVLPSGITFGESQAIDALARDVPAHSPEVRAAIARMNEVMDTLEAASREALIKEHPEKKEAIVKYYAYKKEQRQKGYERISKAFNAGVAK